MRSGVDRGHGARPVEDQDLLAIRRGVVGVEIGAPGARDEPVGETRVGEDRVAVRLDDVDGRDVGLVGIPDGVVDVRGETQDVDHLAGRVVRDLGARPGERVLALVDDPILRRVAPDRDLDVAGVCRSADRGIQLRAVETRDERQAVCSALHREGRHERGAVRHDELDRRVGRDRDALDRVDRHAGKRAVGDRLVEVGPRLAAARLTQDDGRARRDAGQALHVVVRVGPEDVGQARRQRRRDRVGVDHGGQRRPAAARREVRDPGQLDRAEDGRAIEVDGRQPVRRGGRKRRAVAGHEEVLDGVVDRHQFDRLDDAAVGRVDLVEAERGDPPVFVADDQLVAGLIDRQRRGTDGRDGRQQVARHEVVGPDLGPGRDVEALAGSTARHELVEPTRFDDRRDDRDAEVARGGDLVVAERHEAGRHRVLGEVWMRPLVDVVRQAVAPRLEELGRGPRVVDLVEVHLVRLGQSERAQEQGAEDEQDDQEQVEPVEAAAALVAERGAPIRADRRLVEAGLEPADDADLVDRRARRPGRHRGDDGRGRGEGGTRRTDGHRGRR